MKSKLAAFKTITKVDCDTDSFRLERNWELINMATNETVDIQNNPTKNKSELVFTDLTDDQLDYGVYRLVYQVTVFFNKDQDQVNNTVDSYIEIIPTGFVVMALPSGINQIKIGSDKDLKLEPGTYSYDFDNVALPSTLNYSFYCRVSNNSKSFSIELLEAQSQNITISKNSHCFDSLSKLFNFAVLNFKYLLTKIHIKKMHTRLILKEKL
jgi:hypothetical protein